MQKSSQRKLENPVSYGQPLTLQIQRHFDFIHTQIQLDLPLPHLAAANSSNFTLLPIPLTSLFSPKMPELNALWLAISFDFHFFCLEVT
jgi:hypothetical protein